MGLKSPNPQFQGKSEGTGLRSIVSLESQTKQNRQAKTAACLQHDHATEFSLELSWPLSQQTTVLKTDHCKTFKATIVTYPSKDFYYY